MKYIGHKSDDGLNREQGLLEHLRGTANLCANFADGFGMGEVGRLLGLYHDIGKYTLGFQKRIQENGPKVDHSTAGAQILGPCFIPFAFCIAGHHSGLMNLGAKGDMDNGTLVARMHKNLTGKLDFSAFKQELPDIHINKNELPAFSNKYSAMFVTRMLFSSLVDADFLDTEQFMNPKSEKRGAFDSLAILYERYNAYITAWGKPTSKINIKRTKIREECIKAAHGKEGIYSLTVPTGGGKTIASLGFALEHAMYHKNKQRIIYVIPYTSIIEQTADVFREVMGRNNVIEHHMNVDYDGNEFTKNDEQEANERKKLATENWDAPIIVTTNVQFFESLYGNKTSRCRKLHNIANSVVIFDEAQMLPNDFLKPCIRVIQELASNYHVTAVLCTATQPSLDKYFPTALKPQEICADVDRLYEFFKRVNYEMTEFIDTDELVSRLNGCEQVLCIVNSKKTAQEIYDALHGEDCYHLTTSMFPLHRKHILKEVRRHLEAGLPCKLIATSLIEAGVDVDFPVVYRELAGLDSIIQSGGRCNRENKRLLAESTVYIFEFQKDGIKVPNFIRLPREVTKMVMQNFEDISSTQAVKYYFDKLHEYKGESLDSHNILEMSDRMLFSDIASEFKIIGESGRSIFIPCDDYSQKLLDKLRFGIRNRSLMRKVGQYVVNVYENQFLKLQGAGFIDVLDENISVLVDLSIYDQGKGMIVNVDEGTGVFF